VVAFPANVLYGLFLIVILIAGAALVVYGVYLIPKTLVSYLRGRRL